MTEQPPWDRCPPPPTFRPVCSVRHTGVPSPLPLWNTLTDYPRPCISSLSSYSDLHRCIGHHSIASNTVYPLLDISIHNEMANPTPTGPKGAQPRTRVPSTQRFRDAGSFSAAATPLLRQMSQKASYTLKLIPSARRVRLHATNGTQHYVVLLGNSRSLPKSIEAVTREASHALLTREGGGGRPARPGPAGRLK